MRLSVSEKVINFEVILGKMLSNARLESEVISEKIFKFEVILGKILSNVRLESEVIYE